MSIMVKVPAFFYESRLIGYPLKNFRTPGANKIIGHESCLQDAGIEQ